MAPNYSISIKIEGQSTVAHDVPEPLKRPPAALHLHMLDFLQVPLLKQQAPVLKSVDDPLAVPPCCWHAHTVASLQVEPKQQASRSTIGQLRLQLLLSPL